MIRIALLSVIFLAGCTTAAQHQQSLGSAEERQLTVGLVQKEIHNGMAQAEVAEALGSPNLVTKDSVGRETWVYDKFATEASYSHSNLYGTILILGGGRAAGAAGTTQRTLTVVIRFAQDQTVESFSYHSSRF